MRIKYNSVEERLKIINDNSNLFLIGEEQLLEDNYLIFSESEPQIPNYESFQTITENKISSLKTRQANTEYVLMMNGIA